MTFSEDPATPAPPFTGDGSIFDHPDMLLQAPMTQERIVDTQSGFLVVIKRAGEKLALSCKRRVGTPPSSHVLLTPDESIKLSRILAGSAIATDELGDSSASGATARLNVSGRRRFAFTGASNNNANSRSGGAAQKFAKPLVIGSLFAVGALLVFGGFIAGRSPSIGNQQAAMSAADPLSPARIDKFARTFVSDMLDFNPATYKISQIQAMSYMSPELLTKYWQETNFPLNRRQLKALPQGTTVMINKIEQDKSSDDGTSVDIFADLVRSESKTSSPVHIKLKLALNEDGGIRVLEQEDLTSSAGQSTADSAAATTN